jgi:amino acid efflux transporter
LTETTADPGRLVRTMRAPALAAHYIASVMGVGVLVLPGLAASSAGPLSLVAWGLLVAWSFPFALVFARMSMQLPSAGGVADFVHAAFGTIWGRCTALFLAITLLVANPLLGIAAGRYLCAVLLPGAANRTVLMVGFGIILLAVAVNLLGVRLSSRMQIGLLIVLIGFLVSVIVVALPQGQPERLTPFAPEGWGALGPAILVCFFGFIGWENAAPVAEEVVDPRRTFPRAIAAAVAIVGGLYLLMALTTVLFVPAGTSRTEGITAFDTILSSAVGENAATVGNIVAFVLMVLTTNAWCLGTSRVLFSLSRKRLLPRQLLRTSATGTPVAAVLSLVVGYGASVAVLLALDLDESALIDATSGAFLVVFLAAVLAGTRILIDIRLRLLAWLVAVVTVALLPFFLSSLPWAVLFAVVAVVAEAVTRRSAPDPSTASPTGN